MDGWICLIVFRENLSPQQAERHFVAFSGLVRPGSSPVSDTLMAARSQPNNNWGSVGNGAKHR